MNREDTLFMAKLAEQTGSYDDMANYVESIARHPQELTAKERTLMEIAWNNVIRIRRDKISVLCSIRSSKSALVESYRGSIERELEKVCSEILEVINEMLPHCKSSENQVFFHTMKGDCYRFIAEIQREDVRQSTVTKALEAYSTASVIATAALPPNHPIASQELSKDSLMTMQRCANIRPSIDSITSRFQPSVCAPLSGEVPGGRRQRLTREQIERVLRLKGLSTDNIGDLEPIRFTPEQREVAARSYEKMLDEAKSSATRVDPIHF